MKRTRKQKQKKKWGICSKQKDNIKPQETDFSEIEISDLPDKDVKIMTVKMFDKENNAKAKENFQQSKNIRTYQTNQS